LHVESEPTLYQIETQLRAALDASRLRHDTHIAFAPRPRSGWQAGVIPAGSRAAAALVLCYPVAQQVHLVLTRRAGTLGHHAGQVSLPGGAIDGNESVTEAALREAHEEIGLTSEVRVLGPLSPLYIRG
jgi:8-oxo-dGTP pyrophosphatase MutT (NUDIX family)